MPYSIKVSATSRFERAEQPPLFARNFDSVEEYQSVSNLCDNKRRIGWLESLIIPVRTDNLHNFCEDFFLPGFFNCALKTHDVATRILLCIFLPIYDILSLPIRLITAIPRYLYNVAHPKESHPFYQYLINNGVPAATLSADSIYLEREWIETREVFGQARRHDLISEGDTFNFIQLPDMVSEINHYYEHIIDAVD
jgi:hypothetical protein